MTTPIDNDSHLQLPNLAKPDPFSTRYGFIPGRCNAYRHTTGHVHKTEGLCKCWPIKGARRCKLHCGGWHPNGGNQDRRR